VTIARHGVQAAPTVLKPPGGPSMTPIVPLGTDRMGMDDHLPTGRLTGRLITRLALAALGGVLLVVVVLGLWSATTAARSAAEMRRSGDLVEAYLRTHNALSVEDAIEDVYKDEPDPALRPKFDKAAADLDAALRRLAGTGGQADRELARRALPLHAAYADAMRDIFDAADAGDVELVEEINDERADPAQDELQPLINGAGPKYAIAQLRQIDDLRASQAALVRATLIAVPAGAGLYALVLLIVTAYRRRLDRATQAELERLRESLLTDELTRLPNHRAYHHDLDAHFASRAERCCLALVDVVGLKAINDAHGHLAGDARLEAVAAALAGAVDGTGRCYRVGGDKFAVLLPGRTAWTGLALVERARGALEASAGSWAGAGGIRVGVARAEENVGKGELVRRADLALATARTTRRLNVVYSLDLEPTQAEVDDGGGLRALTTALAEAVDAKDSYTRSHCETVSTIAALIASELGVDPTWIAKVRLAGLLHDVGKIGIPLESRIILVADTFEAITSDRSYRRGRSPEEAMRRHSGTQFDPACVAAMERVMVADMGAARGEPALAQRA
jgi:diguanylate cyclase (GGDEF)-like protein